MAEEKEAKPSKIKEILNQVLKVVSSAGFGLVVGTFVYTQGDKAMEFIMQLVTKAVEGTDFNNLDQGSMLGAMSFPDLSAISFHLILSIGIGLMSAVWFYSNSTVINAWINSKIGLALNLALRKKVESDKKEDK